MVDRSFSNQLEFHPRSTFPSPFVSLTGLKDNFSGTSIFLCDKSEILATEKKFGLTRITSDVKLNEIGEEFHTHTAEAL